MPPNNAIQCAYCTRVRLPSGEWSEPLGRKVSHFHRRPVTHVMCEGCEESVFAAAGFPLEEVIAD